MSASLRIYTSMIKYRTVHSHASLTSSPVVPDDSYVSGGRRRPPGHRFLGEHFLLLALLAPLTMFRVGQQSRRERNTKEHQILDRYRIHHRGEGRSVRVLLLQPNERNCG